MSGCYPRTNSGAGGSKGGRGGGEEGPGKRGPLPAHKLHPNFFHNRGVPAIFHVLRVLSTFQKLFVGTLRFRDRTVKVVQYGCQMITGFYGNQLSPELNTGLKNLRGATSNARKWFWFLKSIQHIIWVANNSSSKHTATLLQKIDYIEAIFLALYYGYENRILASRLKLPGFSEQADAYGTNLTWFISDFALLVTTSFRLHFKLAEIREMKEKLRDAKMKLAMISKDERCTDFSTGPLESMERLWLTVIDSLSSTFVNEVRTSATVDEREGLDPTRLKDMEAELERLLDDRYSQYLQWWISFFEVGVSAHYAGYLKHWVNVPEKLLGGEGSSYGIHDGHVGLMGVCSSSLILYQYWKNVPDQR